MQRFINACRVCSHQFPALAVPLQDDSPSTRSVNTAPWYLWRFSQSQEVVSSCGGVLGCSSYLTSAWGSMTRHIGMLSRRAVGGDAPKIIIFTDENRLDLPWTPGEDDRRCLGAGLPGLDHSFLHDQQW